MKEGRMNERAGDYEGMKVEEAKEAIIQDLKDEGIIFDQEDPAADRGRLLEV